VLDEAGLAAAGRAFENHRQLGRMGCLEELNFPPDRQIVRLSRDSVILDCAFRHLCVLASGILTLGIERTKLEELDAFRVQALACSYEKTT